MNPIHYFKTLCDRAEHGNMEVHMGKYYLDNHEWGIAIQLFKKGLEKGNVNDRDEVHRLIEKACLKAGIVNSKIV